MPSNSFSQSELTPSARRFDAGRLRQALLRYLLAAMLTFYGLFGLGQWLTWRLQGTVSEARLFGVPLLDASGGMSVGIVALGGIAVGGIAFGGGAVGVVAFGGGAAGVIAIGGGAVGILAMGGGAVGIVSLGGGAFGYVAVGGGAAGRYVLAGDGWGEFVFSYRRQDEPAVRLFCRLLPRLRRAFPEEGGNPLALPGGGPSATRDRAPD